MPSDSIAAPIVLHCLGTFEVAVYKEPVSGFPTDKIRGLLAYLALEAHTETGTRATRPHRREVLASLLWPEMADSLALTNLRLAIHRLRQTLDRAAPGASAMLLTVTRQTVQINPAALSTDVRMFQERLAACATHDHVDLPHCDVCLERLALAVDGYRGELLTGFGFADAPAFEEWLLLRREMLHQQAITALHNLTLVYEQRGDLHQAHVYARRQLTLDPWREDAHRQLMRILARLGLRSEALAQYEACRRLLRQELGVEPEADTIALYEQIRGGEFDMAIRRQAATVPPHASDHVAEVFRPVRAVARQNWGDLPDVGYLYGRGHEFAQLEHWLAQDRCQLVLLLGIGGVGKTTLAAAVANATAPQFDVVVWRSLLNAPPLDELLRDVLQTLSREPLIDVPASLDAQLALLLSYMRQQRCLLVLDNFESILQLDQPGAATPRQAGYAQLLQIIAQHQHQSCLLLTSRERPQGIDRWQHDSPLVHTLPLVGIDAAAGKAMLTAQGLVGADVDAAALVTRYSGNPLALKLVAQSVQDLFGSDIASFLATEAPIFDDIRSVLDQQFARLSSLEQEILIWLAVEREPISIPALRDNLVDPGLPRTFLEALRGLRRHSLIEQHAHGCALQNVVTEYLTDVVIEQMCQDIAEEAVPWRHDVRELQPARAAVLSKRFDPRSALNRYAVLKATAKEYVRASQIRLIVQPITQRLTAALGRPYLTEKLRLILAALHEQAPAAPGYAAGNLLNLLLHLGTDLQSYDFSHLHVWQAYLRGARLRDMNFRGADLAHSVFTYSFGDILAVHFAADGHLRVAGLVDGRICLWRAADGQLLREYQTFGAGASIATFSPDGRLLASADTDDLVRLWDIVEGRMIYTLSGHTETPWNVIFSPDGTIIASTGRDGVVRMWDVQSGQLRQTLQAHTTGAHALAFTLDGRMLASGDANGVVRLWTVGQSEPLYTLQTHSEEVNVLAFDATGTILASGGYDRTVRIWQMPHGPSSIQPLHTLHAHTQMIRRLMISPDGHTLATGGHDPFVCLWDVRNGQALHTLLGHAYPIHHLAFDADGHTLATIGVDQTICLWDVAGGQRLDTLQVHSSYVYALDFSSDGQLLASGGADSIVHLWDTHTAGRVIRTCKGHAHSIYAVAFSPDATILASGGRDQFIQLCNSSTGQSIRTLEGHTDDVEAIQFSPDGRWLVSASSDYSLRVWDAQTGQIIHVLRGHTNRVRACSVSPHGHLIASASHDRTIRLWDAARGQTIQTLSGHTKGVKWVVFSNDGRLLASSSYDRTIRLWDVASGETRYTWPAQNSTILTMAFHPDDTVLATGATDHTMRLWAVQSGELLATFHGHTDLIEAVAFSPDGRRLASGSADETIRLWDGATGACLSIMRADGPYAGMNIKDVTGISPAQKAALKALGAVEWE